MSKSLFAAFVTICSAGILGCSFALDFDSLSEGGGTGDDTGPCESQADCNDNVDCTVDACNADGTCASTADDSLCAYLEICDAESGCVASGDECLEDVDCDDNVDCTDDICLTGNCYNEPNDSLCVDESNLCVIDRVCVEDIGCTVGDLMECDQAGLGPCEEAVCNPATGVCEDGEALGADDDEDGYLDVECGGDDCADTLPDINPGASESCNLVDDDCDGVTDAAVWAGPVEIIATTSLQATDAAHDGARFAAVWQNGQGGLSEIRMQILGTGECLVDTVCEGKDGLPAFPVMNLTSKGDLNDVASTGEAPAIATDGDTFLVAWVAKAEGQSPRVVLIGVDYDADTQTTAVWDEAEQLSSGDAEGIIAPQIEWNADKSQWVAAWGSEFADGTAAVELTDEGSHESAIPPFAGQQETGDMESLSLALVGADECVVAYSFMSPTDTDFEVYEADFVYVGGAWSYRTGWPKMISAASDAYQDPSSQPVVAKTGQGAWVTVFSDVMGGQHPEGDSDIRCMESSSGVEVLDIFTDTAFDQQRPGIVFDGVWYGLLYSQDNGSGGETLDFRVLDGTLGTLPNQGARFTYLDQGEVRSPKLMAAGWGFAASWIDSEDAQDTLRLAAFTGCEPAP